MRDIFCSYYTNSKDITEYMVSKLGVVDNDIILEPSAGEGIFIDEVLETCKTVQIDALDINSDAISIFKNKYVSGIIKESLPCILKTEIQLNKNNEYVSFT